MPALASDLRRQLENVIIQARDVAEAAARAALKRLAVDAARPFDHFSEAQRQLRNRLRARARQAGDQRQPNGEQEIEQLTQELAYEYWHRMLFARFLAENNLLMHPDGVAVSLADCEELAQVEGAENGWILAARYASRMLPQIFRTDDVLLEIEFPINDRLPLEKLLASLPTETFTADDSLGWVYQFWQSKKKEEVNRSGEKIDGRTLPAVTQLFTEPYMVKFLLHNTIGAWWCARHGIQGPPGGAGVPAGQAPVEMEYLRWRDDGTPAAGTFDGLAQDAERVYDARPLLWQRAFPGRGISPARAAADARRRAVSQRGVRCGAVGEPLRPGVGSALHADRGLCAGPGRMEVPGRVRPTAGLPPAPAAEYCLLRPECDRQEGRVA